MRVVLLTSTYYVPANIAVRDFLAHPGLRRHGIEVVGIASASTFDFSPKSFSSMMHFINRSGWRFFFANIILNIWKRLKMVLGKWFIHHRKREYFSLRELAQQYGIPYLEVPDINGPEAKAFMESAHADVLVSCLLLQIVKKEILDLPPLGSINFHPALTQHHRGTFTSFWALFKNWKHSGATVHYMTEGLDDGQVILQRRFFIPPSYTMHCVNKKSAALGARMLVKALIRIKHGRAKGYALSQLGAHFKMPTLTDVKAFYEKKKSLITWADVFKW